MNHAILCHLRPDSENARKQLRLSHLIYIRDHRDAIVAGGPTLGEDGIPRTMILLTRLSREEAQAFIAAEPYTASGQVFASVEIIPWSQVLPEASPAALDAEISRESP